TSELDEANRDLVVGELRQEALRGCVVVVATHDPDVAAQCDDEVHLVDGVLVPARDAAQAPVDEHDLFRRPR
ncbi:MAG: hypothetical protein ACTHOK_16115, partial [Nocardioidaceae bacterium]